MTQFHNITDEIGSKKILNIGNLNLEELENNLDQVLEEDTKNNGLGLKEFLNNKKINSEYI